MIQTQFQHRSRTRTDQRDSGVQADLLSPQNLPFAFTATTSAAKQVADAKQPIVRRSRSGIELWAMALGNGSMSGAPAADTVSKKQLWIVRCSGDTTEIDLGGAVINSSDQTFLDAKDAYRECAYSGAALWRRPIDKDPVALHAWCHLLAIVG
jgi:hypothetical protein